MSLDVKKKANEVTVSVLRQELYSVNIWFSSTELYLSCH